MYDKLSDTFRQIMVTDLQYGITVQDIRVIYETEEGSIWLGTNGAGLMQLIENNLSFRNIIPQSDEISAYDIRAIAEDNDGGQKTSVTPGMPILSKASQATADRLIELQ